MKIDLGKDVELGKNLYFVVAFSEDPPFSTCKEKDWSVEIHADKSISFRSHDEHHYILNKDVFTDKQAADKRCKLWNDLWTYNTNLNIDDIRYGNYKIDIE